MKEIEFSKECMQVLKYLNTQITEDYGVSHFEQCEVAFEHWYANGGDVWIFTEITNGRNNFSDFNPEWNIGLEPEDLREELRDRIFDGSKIFASGDFHSIIEEICEDILDDFKEKEESFIEQYYPELLENF